MEQYISKDAIVAEIERRLEAIASSSNENNRELAAIIGAQQYELINLALFLNTLEVKEVDLNNSIQLTWEDMRELYIIFAEVDAEIEFCKIDIQVETIGYYQEVLKRFKARKGE